MRLLYVLCCITACASPAKTSAPTAQKNPELNALMNDHVNPAFTTLSFLVFHADTQEDPKAARAELARAAGTLAEATSRLKVWPSPPVQSAQGREVFLTYAGDMDRSAQRLVGLVGGSNGAAAVKTLEQIAKTCNDCHHFFRLDIEDSVVGPGAKR